jgi:hypothetical protein
LRIAIPPPQKDPHCGRVRVPVELRKKLPLRPRSYKPSLGSRTLKVFESCASAKMSPEMTPTAAHTNVRNVIISIPRSVRLRLLAPGRKLQMCPKFGCWMWLDERTAGPLRCAPVGMTILLPGQGCQEESSIPKETCHPDRSAAQWRDLRLMLAFQWVQNRQPDLMLSSPLVESVTNWSSKLASTTARLAPARDEWQSAMQPRR